MSDRRAAAMANPVPNRQFRRCWNKPPPNRKRPALAPASVRAVYFAKDNAPRNAVTHPRTQRFGNLNDHQGLVTFRGSRGGAESCAGHRGYAWPVNAATPVVAVEGRNQ